MDNLIKALDGYRATAISLYYISDVVNNLDNAEEDVASVSCGMRLMEQLDNFHEEVLDKTAVRNI